MLRILKGNWAVAAIILLELLLFIVNFRPGTYLIGWDSVMPELNFAANFKRNIFSVWQEYRGLGLLDGMSYAANLPHTAFLWLLHFVLPQSMLRYFFIFLMHVTGGLGMYFLLRKILPQPSHMESGKATALAGAIFYLLNLATIQMFYAPLEAFAVHFAFLPWLVFSLISYLRSGARRDLLLFVLFSFLSLPQAFVPQLFAVYILLTILVAIFNTKNIKRLIVVVVVIFSINAFWALPYAYSALTNSQTILEAKINQMSSDDIFLKNQARGDIDDVLFMKGFMLDVVEYDKSGQNLPAMGEWVDYTNSPVFYILASFILLLTLLGIVAVISYRQRALYPFLAALVIAFVFLGNNILGLRQFNDFIRENIPVVGEAFRFSFTKFSILFAFCYAIFFAFGVQTLSSRLKMKNLHTTYYILLSTVIFLYALPAFRGHFLFDSLRVTVPVEYQQTFDFFNTQDKNTRIAVFPQPTFWSWRFHNNGYRGSGFLWYGLQQPVLDRAFDPWSGKNENYYWELSYALYSKNLPLLEGVLEKYQINWILVDENVVNPSSPKALFYDETYEMLSESRKIKFIQTFGKIKIYKVNLETPVKDFVYVADNLPTVDPDYKWNNYDVAYADYDNYVSLPTTDYQLLTTDYFYPFRSIFTGRDQKELEFEVQETADYFVFRKSLPDGTFKYIVEVPEINKEDLMWVNPDDLAKVEYLLRDIYLNSSAIEVKVPKVGGYFGADISPASDLIQKEAKNCDNRGNGRVKNEFIKDETDEYLRLYSRNATNCSAAFYLPTLPHNLGYLITIESRNIKGKPPVFWLENLNSRRPDIETHLPSRQAGLPQGDKLSTSYFIQPPMEMDGVGYTIHIDNASIGDEEAINDIGEIKVYPLPYKFLTGLVMMRDGMNAQPSHIEGVKANHPNPSWYEVASGARSTSSAQESLESIETLVLSQAYDEGWRAYVGAPFVGRELKEHVLVNNWSNGWKVDGINSGEKITLFYLPQYLEYLGFALLGVLVSVLIFLQLRGLLNRR